MPDRNPMMSGAIVMFQAGLLLGAGLLGLSWHLEWLDLRHPIFFQPLGIYLVAHALWTFWSWRLVSGTWFDPYLLFASAAFLFNAGVALLVVFPLSNEALLGGRFPQEAIQEALMLVALALTAWHLGALLAGLLVNGRGPKPAPRPDLSQPTLSEVRQVGLGLLILSFPPMLLIFFQAVQTVLSQGYLALYTQEVQTGISAIPQVLSYFLVPGVMFLLAGSRDHRTLRNLAVLVVLINAVCQLFMGFRYFALMPIICSAWVWHRCIRPVSPLPLLTLGTTAVLVVIPLVGTTRNIGAERRDLETLVDSFFEIENPAVGTLREMSSTLRVVVHTVELVPAEREHDFGLTYYYAFLTLIPNLVWDLHPSVVYGRPSLWLAWTVEPWLARRGGSLGYSFIAEAYLAFGWWGLPWIMTLGGYALARLVLWARPGTFLVPARVALVASFASQFVFYAREETAFIVRPLVWYSLAPYLLIFPLTWMRNWVCPPRSEVHRTLSEVPS